MTNRPQILRSSVTGQQPTAGTRAAGELWATFPDKQLGIIDTTRTAQPLIAVRYFSTTANYAVGDLVSRSGSIYSALVAITAGAFNPAQWTKLLVAADLPPGNVPAMNDNRIINGDMRIDQRNGGAVVTANGAFVTDRWVIAASVASKLTFQRSTAGPSLTSFGFGYYLIATTTAAYTPATGESFSIRQPIEADMVSDFAWGTANAQPVTLSFLFDSSSLTGTFSGSIKDYAGTRSYPFTFTVPAANVWQKVVITIPGDTAGSWVMSGNGGALFLCFDLGSGATFRAPAGAWASGNFIGANGAVNSVGTLNNQYQVTGVKLEIGSVATPYNRQSLAKSLADCERYFRWEPFDVAGYGSALGSIIGSVIPFAPQMRVSPTLGTPSADPNLTQTSVNLSTSGWVGITIYGAMAYVTASAAGMVNAQGYRSSVSAEL